MKKKLVFLFNTNSNGYWEVYRSFQGDFLVSGGGGGEVDGGVTWKDLSMEEFVMGEENFNEGGAGFSSIIKTKK